MSDKGLLDLAGLELKLADLSGQQTACVREKRYLEAEELESKMQITRGEILRQKLMELRTKQAEEVAGLEREMALELERFNQFKAERCSRFADESYKLQEELLKVQRERMLEYREKLARKLPVVKRESGEVQDLKFREGIMLKRKKYFEAQQVRLAISVSNKSFFQRGKEARKKRIEALLAQLEDRHQLELNAFRMRSEEGLKLLLKDVRSQHQKLVLRHRNIRNEMKSQHERQVLALQGKLPRRLQASTSLAVPAQASG